MGVLSGKKYLVAFLVVIFLGIASIVQAACTDDGGTPISIFGLRNADGSKYCRAAIEYVSSATRFYTKTAGGTSAASIAPAATGTTYHVWVENVSGGNCTVYVGTTGTKASAASQSYVEDGTGQFTTVRTSARTHPTTLDINGVTVDLIKYRTSGAFGDSGAE